MLVAAAIAIVQIHVWFEFIHDIPARPPVANKASAV